MSTQFAGSANHRFKIHWQNFSNPCAGNSASFASADNLHKAGWSLGWVSALDLEGRTIWIVDAHGYGKRFIIRADEMLTAFVELERAIHEFAVSLLL
jgi:hypothetical protein